MTDSTTKQDALRSIKECLGEEASKYATNKHRGGSNGKKGTRYEDFYMAFKAAEEAAKHIERASPQWPFLHGQIIGFVDDVTVAEVDKTQYFQLKNTDKLSWTQGEHPLVDDFSSQYTLSCYLKEPTPTTHLVVSSLELQREMQKELPKRIKDHSTVIFFPYCDGSANRLVLENVELQGFLKELAKDEDAPYDVLVGVFGVLLLACSEFPNGATIDQILEYTRRYHPHQIRATVALEKVLRGEFVDILARIPGLKYNVKRGFFNWEGFGTSGVFPVDCTDPQFVAFQDVVVQQQPKTFDQFEELLP